MAAGERVSASPPRYALMPSPSMLDPLSSRPLRGRIDGPRSSALGMSERRGARRARWGHDGHEGRANQSINGFALVLLRARRVPVVAVVLQAFSSCRVDGAVLDWARSMDFAPYIGYVA